MEINVSQPISTQKKYLKLYGTSIFLLYNMEFFWNNFQIFLDVKSLLLSLGFRFYPFVCFFPFPWFSCPYLINRDLDEKYIRSWYPSGIFILVDLNKSHIGVLSIKIWILDCHDVLLVCNFHTFWGANGVKNGNLNIFVNMYICKTQIIDEINIIIMKIMQTLVCFSFLNVGR